MGDSDDEYDRRRRDKFRGERTGGSPVPPGRVPPARPRRDDVYDREYDRNRAAPGGQIRSRGDYRIDAYRGGREPRAYSPGPEHSPPHKRMRPEWGAQERPFPPGYGAGDGYAGRNAPAAPVYAGYSDADGPTQPPMMTFKAFLASQDDMITDDEAIKKYTEYKLDFKRQQLNEFFLAHKEEEWFKAKYHPEECVKRQDDQVSNLKRRIEVFLERLAGGAPARLDGDQADALLHFLDSVVIRLEKGTDFDLTVLELPEEDPADKQKPFVLPDNQKKEKKKETEETEKDKDDLSKVPMTEEQRQLQEKAKEFLKKKGEETKKRKYEYNSGSSSSSSSSESEDEAEPSEPAPPGAESGAAKPEESDAAAAAATAEETGKENGDKETPEEGEQSQADVEVPGEEKAKREEDGEKTKEAGEEGEKKEAEPEKKEPEKKKPRPLHKTTSIFLRNLAPTITKAEVEAMCRRYPGFLRAAIADPQPERRWFRRGWVTFERQVNIKEICWNLNNIRLRDCELGAIVNRDLSRRVRTVNGITSHKQVVRADIKLAARIIQNLDNRYRLWPDPDASEQDKQPSYGVSSKNPVLRNITDYLIEEASAEEEELLGVSAASQEDTGLLGNDTIERDDELIKVLDKLLLYLRVVHSVDYYNHSEYPNEDEMPNRCGIVHARGLPPSSKVTSTEVQDYVSSFENKIGSFMLPLSRWDNEDCKKSGLVLKDPEEEVEKFVQANTQELAKDKWLCPLSNKKFKGPDFVRKHIFNKHGEKVDEVKKEVEFFNNYLRDPKRPHLPEHPSAKAGGGGPRKEEPPAQFHVGPYPQPGPPAPPHHGYPGGYGGAYQRPPMYGPPPPRDPYYREPYLPPRDAYPRPPRPNYGARRHVRPLSSYRDLDAPKELDEF